MMLQMRAPCVIFIDEIDSVGGKRSSSEMHPYANQTINQLLTEMDGFQSNEGVIVLGATNKRENLDKWVCGELHEIIRFFAEWCMAWPRLLYWWPRLPYWWTIICLLSHKPPLAFRELIETDLVYLCQIQSPLNMNAGWIIVDL